MDGVGKLNPLYGAQFQLLGTRTGRLPRKLPELDHICCCDPATALCGAKVAGQDVKFGGPETSKNPCRECFNRAADGEKCGMIGCPGGEE